MLRRRFVVLAGSINDVSSSFDNVPITPLTSSIDSCCEETSFNNLVASCCVATPLSSLVELITVPLVAVDLAARLFCIPLCVVGLVAHFFGVFSSLVPL